MTTDEISNVPNRDGHAPAKLFDLMQIVHLEPAIGAQRAAVASCDVAHVGSQRVPVELAAAAEAKRVRQLAVVPVDGAVLACRAVVVGLEHAYLLQELLEVELGLVGAEAHDGGVVVARRALHRRRGRHRLLQRLEARHGRRQSRGADAVGDGGAGRRGGERRRRRVGARRRTRRRLGRRRRRVLELLQPLVYDVDVVLRVEVEEAVGGDGGGAPPCGGGGREPPEALVRGGGGGGAEVGQVEEGVGAVEPPRGLVVGERRLLGGGEGAEPEARPLVGLADLGYPLPPRPLPHAAVLARRVLRPALPPRRPLLPRPLPPVALHTAIDRARARDAAGVREITAKRT